MTILGCNIFINVLSLTIPRMSILFVYIWVFVFVQDIEK